MKESFAENSEGTSDKPFFMRNPNMPSLSDGSDPCIRIRQTYSIYIRVQLLRLKTLLHVKHGWFDNDYERYF